MKRLLLFAVMALTLLVIEPLPPAAVAHGTCSSNAALTFSGDTVVFSAALACSENHPAGYGLSADLYRRLPGGSWARPPSGTYHIHTTCTSGGKTCSTPAGLNSRNCRYDYKATATGYVIGGHSIPSDSTVKSHTC